MADYKIPTLHGGYTHLTSCVRDTLSTLDIVWSNKFEDEEIDENEAKKKEADFYTGTPPQWLNFYWAEKKSRPFVERDIYKELKKKVKEKRDSRWNIVDINLFHQPGSGGSTLSMQLLWDFRKKLRCAKVKDFASDTKVVAKHVISLFTEGGPNNQNTVLLLLDNKDMGEIQFKKSLQDSLFDEVKARNLNVKIPVVIIVDCQRKKNITGNNSVILKMELSPEEQSKFQDKSREITQEHGRERQLKFHAFNIMQRNFDPAYVTEVCSVLEPVKRRRGRRKAQLFAFLALVNSYVPGSYLPLDLCGKFIDPDYGRIYLENKRQPFEDLLITFSHQKEGTQHEEKHIRTAHPMIATRYLGLLTEAGITRGETTRMILTEFCRDAESPYLMQIIKKLLTKREVTKGQEKETFSELIQDIKRHESRAICVRILRDASDKFNQDPFFPQALARFYLIEERHYQKAENWAQIAIARDSDNSFIRDTLAQIHKNHLRTLAYEEEDQTYACEILRLGHLAIEAFRNEGEAAEKEEGPDLKDDGVTKISYAFNNKGLFGYLQVAKLIHFKLTKCDLAWSEVLTHKETPDTFFKSQRGKLHKHKALLTSLREGAESKFEFFQSFLTYSKPSIHESEPAYFWPEVEECHKVYAEPYKRTPEQILKEKKAWTSAGLLSCLNQDSTVSDLEDIVKHWKKIFEEIKEKFELSDAHIVQNYVLANIILSNKNATSGEICPQETLMSTLRKFWEKQKTNQKPEFYLLILLLFWPDERQQQENHKIPDLEGCIKEMHKSFEQSYGKYLRSRFLVPLFFLGQGEGLQRLVHRSKLDADDSRRLIEFDGGLNNQSLIRVKGEIRNHRVYALNGNEKIEVSPNNPASVRNQGLVTFYLGFNIKGPVAFNIMYSH